jgi:uncharacterized membrane protein (UPF0127 family)
MLFMNFDITVVWLDRDYRVVDVRLAKRWHPWYIPERNAKYILEAHSHLFNCFQPGDQIKLYDR